MRILLDEQLPRALAADFPDQEVETVQSQGWSGIQNGRLLQLAGAAGFDVFLTADRGIEFQQNVTAAGIAIVMLVAPSNRLESLRPLVPEVVGAISGLRPGVLIKVGTQP